jgi:hypothetical protein
MSSADEFATCMKRLENLPPPFRKSLSDWPSRFDDSPVQHGHERQLLGSAAEHSGQDYSQYRRRGEE